MRWAGKLLRTKDRNGKAGSRGLSPTSEGSVSSRQRTGKPCWPQNGKGEVVWPGGSRQHPMGAQALGIEERSLAGHRIEKR